jgi:hypothetical protein
MVTVRCSSDLANDGSIPSFAVDLPAETRFKDVMNALRAASLTGRLRCLPRCERGRAQPSQG